MKKIYLSTPTMHGEELKYMTEAYETNWMSTVGKNIAIVFLIYMGIGLLAVPILLLVFSILIYTEATELLGSVSAAEQSVITFLALIILTMAAVIVNVILYKDNLSRIKNKLNLT